MHPAKAISGYITPSSRRGFVLRTAVACSAVGVSPHLAISCFGADADASPIVVFSKVFQELKLSFEQSAEMTAQSGLDGVDCPVRPEGEILPERASEELPRYAQILRQRNLKIRLLTTAIVSPSTPQAEAILRTAKKLGVEYYRLGFIQRKQEEPLKQQVREVRSRLKDLAALNREIGMCALLQNHSSSGSRAYFGGLLPELVQAVEGFDPAQIGVAFDIGHALVMHGDDWRRYFDQLKPHFRIAYIKDVKRQGGWVPFGQGEIASTGYFQILREMHYHAPVSLHVEFNWGDNGKNRENLAKALTESATTLRGWLRG